MDDREFGIWVMENLELLIRESGRLLPETSDHNIVHNSQVLLEEFRKRHPGQGRKAKATEGGTADA